VTDHRRYRVRKSNRALFKELKNNALEVNLSRGDWWPCGLSVRNHRQRRQHCQRVAMPEIADRPVLLAAKKVDQIQSCQKDTAWAVHITIPSMPCRAADSADVADDDFDILFTIRIATIRLPL
jgi:hypothetical protein